MLFAVRTTGGVAERLRIDIEGEITALKAMFTIDYYYGGVLIE